MKIFSKLLLVSGAACVVFPAQALPLAKNDASVTASALTLKVASDKAIKGAESFIGSMTKRGIDFLGNENMTKERQKEEFKKLLNDSFDMRTIGRFSLGRYWRTASTTQQKEYLSLFRAMILNVYSARFSEYKGQALEVTSARAEGKSDVLVTSIIKGNGDPEVQVDWRVRYKNGHYKVIDIVVEGVSMGLTQRSDFASVIQRGGGNIDVLLEHLRK